MLWEILDSERFTLLKKISEQISLQDYYMGGDTALALQIVTR